MSSTPNNPDLDLEEQESEAAPLHELADSIILESKQSRPVSAVETSIRLLRHILDQRPPPHPLRGRVLHPLSMALLSQFTQIGRVKDVDEALALLREALTGESAYTNLNDMNRSDTSAQNNALANGEQPSVEDFALYALSEFWHPVQSSNIESAVYLYREALLLRSSSNPSRSTSLLGLAAALVMQFCRTERLQDLDEAISLLYDALLLRPSPDPGRFLYIIYLCICLCMRISHTGNPQDLVEALSLRQEAKTEDEGARESMIKGTNVLDTFLIGGNISDLNVAVPLLRTSLSLRPSPHPHRSDSLNNLALALYMCFMQMGQPSDLDESISYHREALDLSPPPHPTRSYTLVNLATALQTRYQHMSQPHDLEDAISFYREALDLYPDRPGLLGNLATVLLVHFDKMNELSDLEESIAFHREALELRPHPHPDRSNSLNLLGMVLHRRFLRLGIAHDLTECISLCREALDLRPPPHPKRSAVLNNLAVALNTRFEKMGQLDDLMECIALYKSSISLLSVNYPSHSVSQSLGRALVNLYVANGQSNHLDEAMSAFQDAVTRGLSPLNRYNAACVWAYDADIHHHPSALDAFQRAVDLLPQLAALGRDLKTRLEVLSRANGLACHAASCAIRAGDLEKAVEFLSEGRAVFWTQALRLRTPFDELKSVAPVLAQKLQDISDALEQGSHRNASRNMGDTPAKITTMEQEASRYSILNDDWNSVLEEVRTLEGFQDFLRPKSFHALQQAASYGPIVLLNAGKFGCDGLIITLNSVIHVPFPDLTLNHVKALGFEINIALSPSGTRLDVPDSSEDILEIFTEKQDSHEQDPVRYGGVVRSDPSPEDRFRRVLGMLWSAVVCPVIQTLNLQKSDSPARLWWCPTGPFAFLPIHAAGKYDANGRELESLSDYAISSYTPTLDAFLTPPSLITEDFKVLAVIQPTIPGQPHLNLPFTRKELQKIEQQVPEECLVSLGTPKEDTSIENVLSHLSSSSIVHFACHGVQNLGSPLDSALLLGDGRLKVSKIMEHPLRNASLAFLSACETATGDKKIPDEAMHIAATMLFAGFRGVVGTMWSIYDEDAPDVAEAFYGHLFKDSGTKSRPATMEAARALHLAVRKLRTEKNISFRRWVPFIHLGL